MAIVYRYWQKAEMMYWKHALRRKHAAHRSHKGRAMFRLSFVHTVEKWLVVVNARGHHFAVGISC